MFKFKLIFSHPPTAIFLHLFFWNCF